MKKTLILAALIANAFMACKKADRVCECSVTKTGTSTTMAALTFSLPLIGNVPIIDTSFVTTVSDVFTYERTLVDVTKKQAKNNCLGYEEPYKEVTTNSAPPLLLVTTETGNRVYDCNLK
jgi:hypothetical protein